MPEVTRERWSPLDRLGLSLSAGACELYLVRHGNAVPDTDRTERAYDDYEQNALSTRGREQAAATGERFARIALAAVYTSPIRRARETAEAIAAATGAQLHEELGLREVDLGVLEGEMSMRERLAHLAMIAMRDGGWSIVPGTEPSADVRARMRSAVDAIAARHRGERVGVVSHAGAINALLGDLAGSTHDFIFPLANASVSVIRINGDTRLLMSANDTSHLHGAGTSV
jgi:probable phosphoglycerate mutase